MSDRKNVTIIGGAGNSGFPLATFLHRAGYQVEIIDPAHRNVAGKEIAEITYPDGTESVSLTGIKTRSPDQVLRKLTSDYIFVVTQDYDLPEVGKLLDRAASSDAPVIVLTNGIAPDTIGAARIC